MKYPIKSDMYNMGFVIDYDVLIKLQSNESKIVQEDYKKTKPVTKVKKIGVIRNDKCK